MLDLTIVSSRCSSSAHFSNQEALVLMMIALAAIASQHPVCFTISTIMTHTWNTRRDEIECAFAFAFVSSTMHPARVQNAANCSFTLEDARHICGTLSLLTEKKRVREHFKSASIVMSHLSAISYRGTT